LENSERRKFSGNLLHGSEKKTPGLTQRPRASTGTFTNQAAQGMGTVQSAHFDVGSRWGGRKKAKLRQEAASRRVSVVNVLTTAVVENNH
jgi:hypothetical protein